MPVWVQSVEPSWFLVAGLSLAFLLWRLGVHLRGFFDSQRRQQRLDRAMRAEEAGERLLERAGWSLVDTQVTRDWTIHVDEHELSVQLRADAIVERRGERCVAEFKSGLSAPQLKNSATRRQLLEYRLAYGVNAEIDAVLLVDIEAGRIRRLAFPGLSRQTT
mgnify:CR=1 FL=1